LEVKVPRAPHRAKSRQSESQVRWQGDWEAFGGRYFVVRSAQDTLEALDSIDKEIA